MALARQKDSRAIASAARWAGDTLSHSPEIRNNPFSTARVSGDTTATEGLQNVLMKLAVLEHQQNSFDAKLMELDAYMKSSLQMRSSGIAGKAGIASSDVSVQLCKQLWELKEELKLAAKEDELHRVELQKQVSEGQKELRRELFDVIKSSSLDFKDAAEATPSTVDGGLTEDCKNAISQLQNEH
eukprot:symbB.v1.2.000546.t1/scaffold19.1/size443072/10